MYSIVYELYWIILYYTTIWQCNLHTKVRESGTMVCRISFPRLARAKLSLSSVNSILVKSLLDLLVELFIRCSCMWIWMCMLLLLIGKSVLQINPPTSDLCLGGLLWSFHPFNLRRHVVALLFDDSDLTAEMGTQIRRTTHCEDDCYSCKVGLRPLTTPVLFLKIPAVLIRSMHNMVKVCCQHLLCC